jgi:O-antigen/teichoic acid export membrane protein
MTALAGPQNALRSLARDGPLSRVFIVLCGTGGTALFGFIAQALLARGLRVGDYGHLAALLAVVNVVTPLANCSIGWFWLQVYGEEGRSAVRWILPTVRVSIITTAVSLVLLIVYIALTQNVGVGQITVMSLMLTPVLIGQSLAESTSVRLQLEERYLLFAVWQFLTQLGRVLVVLMVLATGRHDLNLVLWGYAVVGGTIAAISAKSVDGMRRGRVRPAGHPDNLPVQSLGRIPPLWIIFRDAIPYGLITIFYLLYSQAIVAIVGVILGHEAAAMYNVAFLIVAAIYLIPSVIYTKYLVSKIFRWWVHDREMFAAVFHVGVVTQLALGLIFMFAIMATAHGLVPLLFGQRYVRGVPILLILAFGIPVRFVGHAYGSAFFSKDNVPRKVRYMAVASAVAVIFNLVLQPLLGLAGAAVSAVCAEVALLILYIQGTIRHVGGIDVTSSFRIETIRGALACVAARDDVR